MDLPPFSDLKDPWLASAWSGFRDLVALHLRCIDRLGREPELPDARAQLQRWMGQASVDIAGEPFTGLQVWASSKAADWISTRSSSSMSMRASCRTEVRRPRSCRSTFSGHTVCRGVPNGTAFLPPTSTGCSTAPALSTSSMWGPTSEMGPPNPVDTSPN